MARWFSFSRPLTHKVTGGYSSPSIWLTGATPTSRAPAFILPPANGISDPGLSSIGITQVAPVPTKVANPRGRGTRTVFPSAGWHPLV